MYSIHNVEFISHDNNDVTIIYGVQIFPSLQYTLNSTKSKALEMYKILWNTYRTQAKLEYSPTHLAEVSAVKAGTGKLSLEQTAVVG